MLFPLQRLIDGNRPIVCISKDNTIRQALDLMLDNDFGQLPILDREGFLIGLLTEQRIIQHYRLIGYDGTLQLSVLHLSSTPITLPPNTDIFVALKQMKDTSSIVVTEGRKPVGIITDYDTTLFFRDLSEGMILVEDIETNLRQLIEGIFPEGRHRSEALIFAFGKDSENQDQPRKDFDEMTMGDTIRFVSHEKNWSKFQPIFEPRELFLSNLYAAKEIRNKLAHFRGRLDKLEYQTLLLVRDWLDSRPRSSIVSQTETRLVTIPATAVFKVSEKRIETLAARLNSIQANHLTLSFENFESLFGSELPEVAKQHRSWWDNEVVSNPHARAWLEHGWKISDVDFLVQEVTLSKTILALTQLFLVDMLARLREARPGLTNAARVGVQNWINFSGGRYGFLFGWVFGHNTFRVEIYIDTGGKVKNKTAFDQLFAQSQVIEPQIGQVIEWERLNDRKASRIKVERPFQLTSASEAMIEEYKQWGLETMFHFLDVFREYIRVLNLD